MCQPETQGQASGGALPEWTGALPDEAVLVRAGIMNHGDLRTSAKVHFARHGVYALSLWSYPMMGAQEIAEEVGRVADEHEITLLPNPQMRQTTVGALRALGYDVTPGGGLRGHVTLALNGLPDDTEWTRLATAFQEAETNPIAQRMRQQP